MVIAVVRCKKSAEKNCIAGCLKAYAEGAHPGEQPGFFFHCCGCDNDPEVNEEFTAKLDKLKEKGVTKVHFTSCVGENCPNLERLEKVFLAKGFEPEFGYREKK